VLGILHRWGIESLSRSSRRSERSPPGSVRSGFSFGNGRRKNTRLLKLVPSGNRSRKRSKVENRNETSEPLLFHATPLSPAISVRLARSIVASELQFEIIFSDKSGYSHPIQNPEPTNIVEILFRMLTRTWEFYSKSPIRGRAEGARRPSRPSNGIPSL
jgi:hypothetical protein